LTSSFMRPTIETSEKESSEGVITPMEASGTDRKLLRIGLSQGDGSSLNIETVLQRARETNIVEARKRTLERLGFTEWKIWKFLRIEWK